MSRSDRSSPTTVAPYPVANADVIYARYLLTHVADPSSVLAACATAMRRRGRLVLEENCALESPDPLFADYYDASKRCSGTTGKTCTSALG
jgi:hypothetical protein